ncbi:MAG TPA: hypothetical protein VMY40_12750 [Anaerolineae bacterium]|nr:hypothetical protein [Anaerolineae bacterium]
MAGASESDDARGEVLAPVIIALGEAETVAETTRAIQDVGRWWP